MIKHTEESIYEPFLLHDSMVEDEPINEYREASKRLLDVMSLAMDHVTSSPSPQVAAWGVSLALATANNEGISITDRAGTLGIGVAALSKSMQEFIKKSGLDGLGYSYKPRK